MNDTTNTPVELKFVDPKNDVAFRKIFGDENKKEILISFLNNILEFTGTNKEIIEITIQNPYQVPKLKELKETILDIKSVDKRNIHYIIEMQMFHTSAFESAKQMRWSKEELEAYDDRGIYIQDERGRIQYALEEGEKMGYEKGEKVGINKGRDENAREMAKTMKIKGHPLEEISELTKIPREEIEKL